jgi:hypothetical protein
MNLPLNFIIETIGLIVTIASAIVSNGALLLSGFVFTYFWSIAGMALTGGKIPEILFPLGVFFLNIVALGFGLANL